MGIGLDRLDGGVRLRGWCQGSVDRCAAAKPPLTPAPHPKLGIQAIKTTMCPHLALSGDRTGAVSTQGVPRSTTVLTKISSFLAQATSAALCSFPAALRR